MEVYQLASEKHDISLFSDLPLYIKYEVLRGQAVVINDKKFLIKIKEEVLREYYDMKPIWGASFRIRKAAGRRVVL